MHPTCLIKRLNYPEQQSPHQATTNWAIFFNGIDQPVETVVIDDDSFERELCKGKGGEWFRLQAGDDNCRDVIQCTTSVSFSTFNQQLLLIIIITVIISLVLGLSL